MIPAGTAKPRLKVEKVMMFQRSQDIGWRRHRSFRNTAPTILWWVNFSVSTSAK